MINGVYKSPNEVKDLPFGAFSSLPGDFINILLSI